MDCNVTRRHAARCGSDWPRLAVFAAVAVLALAAAPLGWLRFGRAGSAPSVVAQPAALPSQANTPPPPPAPTSEPAESVTKAKKPAASATSQRPAEPAVLPASGKTTLPPALEPPTPAAVTPVPAAGSVGSSSNASPAAAPAVARGAHPCEQITNACRDAGFVSGAGKSGNGLFADCIFPIIQGTPQPRNSAHPLPQIGADIITACKVINPSYGHNPRKRGTEASTGDSTAPPQ